ncbi:hypothetical protein GCM10023082_35590 [Streptomyces tremellae]|uniref:Uncharacterized protein n=1 Tax=Streptomyces tremellae TaxID=1124239 RepID=A0ABP7FAX9_9ACTN
MPRRTAGDGRLSDERDSAPPSTAPLHHRPEPTCGRLRPATGASRGWWCRRSRPRAFGATHARARARSPRPAAALGAGYGIALPWGLLEIRRTTTPSDLTGPTGAYHAPSPTELLLSTVLAPAPSALPHTALLALLAACAAVCLRAVTAGSGRRAKTPSTHRPPGVAAARTPAYCLRRN